MKKLLLATAVFIGFWILGNEFASKRKTPTDLDPGNATVTNIGDDDLQKIVRSINEKNKVINTLQVASMPIRLRSSGMSFRLTGNLAYEKPRNFRLQVLHKITGKEMDIGSNRNIFWFWSKRISPPALYFSRHENIQRTNLKSALNPMLMIDSLNVSQIDLLNARNPRSTNELFIFSEARTSPSNERLELTTFIDKSGGRILRRVLSYEGGDRIVTTTYTGDSIVYDYHAEGATMEWDLSDAKNNVNLPASLWEMPHMTRTIDIGNE